MGRSYLLAHMCFLTVNVSAYQSNHGKEEKQIYVFSSHTNRLSRHNDRNQLYIFFPHKTISCHDILHVSVILYLFSYQFSLQT